MRKLYETVRFPQSVELFRFCLRILELRTPEKKIHDQDLGQILNFNPSDTSHWKRGKKAIRNIQALEILAKTLNVDLEIIQDLAEGVIDLDEAWSDFYDSEEERKLSLLSPELRIERRDRTAALEVVAKNILTNMGIQAVPVYVPELIAGFNFIQLIPGEVSEKLARSSRIKPGYYAIRYRKGDIRAHTRIAIVREIARVILLSERERFGIRARNEALSNAEIIELAACLLVPREALALETQKISTRVNMVKALAELFWVPKSVIRSRLTTLLMENASPEIFTQSGLSLRLRNDSTELGELPLEDLDDDNFNQPPQAAQNSAGHSSKNQNTLN